MLIPAFSGVRLFEYSGGLGLTPIGWFRDSAAYGKFKADKVGVGNEPDHAQYSKWKTMMGSNEIWVIVNWMVFDDDSETVEHAIYCGPETPQDDARKLFDALCNYLNSEPADRGTKAGVSNLAERLRQAAPGTKLWVYRRDLDDLDDEPEDRRAIIQNYSDQKTPETKELYQARLRALAGVQPKTAALIWQADQALDEAQRRGLERDAVEAFFAELGTYWPNDVVKEWQRHNPVGVKWLEEFVKLLKAPERILDPVNHEIVLNWLRRGYNLMTEKELSDAILKSTGQYVKPNTVKKKRQGLGLTARPAGPRPNSEQ